MVLIGVLALGGGGAAPRITADLVYAPPPPAEAHVVHLKSFNSLHELVSARPSLLDVLRGGVVSPHVGTPAGIAYRSGHLYICDTQNRVVHDWDLATGQGRRIGAHGQESLGKPVAVAVDHQGTVYVADTELARVLAFDADHRSVRGIKPPDRKTYRPAAVAVRNGELYVADIAGHCIDTFSTASGHHLNVFGRIGSEPGRMYFPTGVAVDGGGRILVSDMMNARVQVFDGQGQPVLSMGRPGNRYGDLGKPRHLAVGPDQTIFIADMEFCHVHLFDKEGRLLMLFGGAEDRPGGTPMPVGVAVARSLPEEVASLVPAGFAASYFVFVTNTIGAKRIGLYAVK